MTHFPCLFLHRLFLNFEKLVNQSQKIHGILQGLGLRISGLDQGNVCLYALSGRQFPGISMWFRSLQLELHVDPGTNFYIIALQLGIAYVERERQGEREREREGKREKERERTHQNHCGTVKNTVVWALPRMFLNQEF